MSDKKWTVEEYVNHMIKNGYRDKDLSPIKCFSCESKNLEDYEHYYENAYFLIEYSVRCKDCGEHLASWAYGNWCLY